jgi:hypothetical protein
MQSRSSTAYFRDFATIPGHNLLSGKRQAPDGTPLGRAPASGRKAAGI